MITKIISGINFNNVTNPQKSANKQKTQPSFGSIVQADTFLKTAKSYTLDEAVSELYRQMSSPEVQKAEVPFTNKGLILVNLDNMKLKMEKAIIEDKNKILTFFSHETECSSGKVNCVMMTRADDLDEAVKKLRSKSFIEELEKMTDELDKEPEYIDLRG